MVYTSGIKSYRSQCLQAHCTENNNLNFNQIPVLVLVFMQSLCNMKQ